MFKYLPRIIAIALIHAVLIAGMCLDRVFMVMILVIYGIILFMYLVGTALHNTFDFRKWGSIHGGW